MNLFNLENQYLFYRSYHKNPVNQLLHIFYPSISNYNINMGALFKLY